MATLAAIQQLAHQQAEMAAELHHIALLIQAPQGVSTINLINAGLAPPSCGKLPFASFLCTCQVNAHGAAIQVVPLDIGVPMPNWLAAWFLGNPVLRWVLSITVSVLSVAAGMYLGTYVGEAILPTAVLFG
jgi:hypothetical protein